MVGLKEMNQQSLKAYLDLIEGLLSCPRGEEWILLRQNEGLVNHELVAVMEQVANHLVREGNVKAAKYLHNWAGKLHHIVTENIAAPTNKKDKTQDYVELIQALIDCPEGEEEAILEAHQDLINPELVRVMEQVAEQMAVEGDRSTASFLAGLTTDLNRSWLQKHEFKPTFKPEIAPDPWFDSVATPEPSVTDASSAKLETQSATATENSITSAIDTPQTSTVKQSPVEASVESNTLQQSVLREIAESLVRLENMLATRLQPPNPLWYMEILEKAEVADWILSTDEIEHLIGVKPHCHQDETTYSRGSWAFVKAGKIGSQIGWKIKKQRDSVS